MPGFKIRRASAKDLGLLVDHRQQMFEEMTGTKRGEANLAGDAYRNWAKEMLKQKLYHGYIVTDIRGSVATSGCVWLRQVQPSRGHPASLVPYLMSMYTAPEFRRKGLASIIVKQAMAWAKKNRYTEMYLHASVTGRKVYSQLGWERVWEMEVDLARHH
jgi:GNAT superfamily N-acetyltransferase